LKFRASREGKTRRKKTASHCEADRTPSLTPCLSWPGCPREDVPSSVSRALACTHLRQCDRNEIARSRAWPCGNHGHGCAAGRARSASWNSTHRRKLSVKMGRRVGDVQDWRLGSGDTVDRKAAVDSLGFAFSGTSGCRSCPTKPVAIGASIPYFVGHCFFGIYHVPNSLSMMGSIEA
jgi:hypothetical protein